ncbi:MAG TPA: bifunctional diaminohydroxyphosphoribosylaminopyrimidine deaminase/5-amino-6-(5-phosphoribosylamino)uracil reductase RibD [Desulfomonilaceae bacterium]|nr:bifunctional diaminohydroxyphosphoribosylaminopyrimidine deaminase/5-amino-6-(5-phosphoribosylamino)uracil reductase RibD [Desulfomonilaceae bacterium]
MKAKEYKVPREAERFMGLALKLARRALGRTSPNPAVGAVIVKDGRVVGKGYHRAAGEPHAEVEAIRAAGSDAKGAELFVTLEPCNHHGRTPPCTEAILEAGISKVWYGTDDPNPGVRGGGARLLGEAGVEVVGHVIENRCRRINEVYLTNISLRRPFVYLKLAMSMDGRIATRTGHSQWITSAASRRKVHRLRDRVSAIMVGVETVIADNPALTARLPDGRGHDPIRIVADSNLRTPLDAGIFNPDSPAGVIIATRKDPPADRKVALEKKGAKIVGTSGSERVDLQELLSRLYAIGVTSVLIEGGAGLAWGALEAGVVDRCLFFYAPMIIGGSSAPAGVGGTGISRLEEAPRLVDVRAFRIGPDILLDGRVAYPNTDQLKKS